MMGKLTAYLGICLLALVILATFLGWALSTTMSLILFVSIGFVVCAAVLIVIKDKSDD